MNLRISLASRRRSAAQRTGSTQQISQTTTMPLWLTAGGVVLIALNLRPPITAVSPLLDQVQRQLNFNSTTASLLVAVPLICFVIFSPVTPRIGHRFGLERCVELSMLVLIAGHLVRLIPAIWALFLGTAIIGLAITMGNVLLPAAIKRDHPARTGLLVGLYTMSLYIGAASAAGFTLPLQRATGLDWRGTLGLWAAVAAVGLLAWRPQVGEQRGAGDGSIGRYSGGSLWRQPLAWAVTISFAMPTLMFYTLSAWMPTILMDAGIPPERAGGMLAIVNLAAIPFALVISIMATRTKQQIWCTSLGSLFLGIGVLGSLITVTSGTAVWMIFFGMGLGAGTGLGYTIPLLRSRDSRTAAQLGAMSQTVGFMLSALGPVLAGALHDVTGGWTTTLVMLAFLVVVQAIAGFGAGRARFVS